MVLRIAELRVGVEAVREVKEEGDCQVRLSAVDIYCGLGTSCFYFSLAELSGTHAPDTEDREVTTTVTWSRPVLFNLPVLSSSSTASGTSSSLRSSEMDYLYLIRKC
jgi:hypothetical protein